ncbi:MAG: RagB/SusD family nutrient uptake outer membrane protein, partial [Cytophagales bacterium]|nr:RagB/SusD family nutrient uptake outer membrane protein [Cytophagales bacterium]
MSIFSSCTLLHIDPEHVVSSNKAFGDVASYEMALNKLYRDLTTPIMNMQSTDFATDDFGFVIPGYSPTNYYIYNWDYKTQPQPFVWRYQYQLIAQANVLTDNFLAIPVKTKAEQDKRNQVYAQALGMRAWFFFRVAQLYAPRYDQTNGDKPAIPLKLKLELEFLPKATLKQVYSRIFADLDKAEELLKQSDFSDSNAYVFGTKAVRALRARVALFVGDLEMAKMNAATFVNTSLLSKENYWMLWEDKFGSLNKEIIFMTHDLSDTDDADLVDYHQMYVSNAVSLSKDFVKTFGAGDVRKDKSYIGSNGMPHKHIIPVNERNNTADRNLHYKHFRLAEQYLIYAESVLQSNPAEAMRVLNKL